MKLYLQSPACWALFLGALIFTLLITPFVIRIAWRIGAVDRGGYRKINGHKIPLMGGLAIVLPFLAVCFLGIIQPTPIFAQLGERYKDLALLAAGGVILATLGVIDDIRGLGAKEKFLVQILVALLVCLAGKTLIMVNLPFIGTVNLGVVGGMILTILWVVGMINAFNLVDGVDGLAAGLALVSSIGLGIVAALNGHTMVVLVCLGLAGSLSGFLVFNFHPAKIFLGDTGSLFLGFTMATISLLGASKTTGSIMLLTPMLALGFPIFDTVTSMIRRILRGRNPFIGDRSHTHHRLLDYGYTQRQVVLILYSVAIMCTISSILSQILYPQDRGPLLAIGIYASVVIFIAWINGYLRLRHALRVSWCRARNGKLESFTKYARLSYQSDASLANLQEIMRLGCKELQLRFLEMGLDGDPDGEVLISVSLKGGEDVDNALLDPVEELRVQDAGGRLLAVHYQLNHRNDRFEQWDEHAREMDKLEHQDVMACLAHLFNSIHVGSVPNDEFETDATDLKKMAVIHDMRRINSKN